MRKLWLLLPAGVVLGALMVRNPAAGQAPDGFGTLRPSALPAGVQPAAPAGPANPFPLTPAAGPWLICAAHYPGPEGMDLALQTVNDLRTRLRLQAFILNRGEEERRKQDAEWKAYEAKLHGAPARRRMIRVEDEYAVLVGGYADLAAATAALPRVRALPMPGLNTKSGASPFAEMFYTVPGEGKAKVMTAKVNPYSQAMVVRNPTVPASAERSKADPFLKQLNANEEYSLLKVDQPYTLLIREYQGGAAIQSEAGANPKTTGSTLLKLLGLGGGEGEGLSASAAQAHELARWLREPRIGLEAHVLHTRRSSMVTVGGFASQTDQAILNVARQLAVVRRGSGTDVLELLPDPIVIAVPRP